MGSGPIADWVIGFRDSSNCTKSFLLWRAVTMKKSGRTCWPTAFCSKHSWSKQERNWENGRKVIREHVLSYILVPWRTIPYASPSSSVVEMLFKQSISEDWQCLVSAPQLDSWTPTPNSPPFCCLRPEYTERVIERVWSLSLEVNGLWEKRENCLCPIWFPKVREVSAQQRGNKGSLYRLPKRQLIETHLNFLPTIKGSEHNLSGDCHTS